MVDIRNLQAYAEDNRIEAKKARNNIPASIWETYSSFANTDGGIILLGVEENADHTLRVVGVEDAHKMQAEFWNMVNNRQKVNLNILTNRMVEVQEYDGKQLLVISVPKVDRKQRPVYVGLDPMKGTYRRNFEGDYLCTVDEVSAMYRDASVSSIDTKVLKMMDMTVLDMDTVHRYRNRFKLFHNNHVWNDEEDEVFLRRIGAMAVHEEDMLFHPTAAGLLMFGREYDIVREFPDYFLDYQEKLSEGTRWTHRMVSTSGDWSGNLYDFFFRVYPRITADLPVPFITKGIDRIDDTELHLALREVLLNTCAHADHYGRQGIVIVKTLNEITISNPGNIRIGLKAALVGGVSDPRNVTIMKMFALIGIGERAGTGIPEFMKTWQTFVGFTPSYSIYLNPERTRLVIPYTFAALQQAGEKLSKLIIQSTSDTPQSTSQSTSDTPQSTLQSTSDTPQSTLDTPQSTLDILQSTSQSTLDATQSTLQSTLDTPQSTLDASQSTSQSTLNTPQSTLFDELSETAKEILEIIKENPKITYSEIAVATGKARSGISRHIKRLQEKGLLKKKDANGEWKVID